MRLTTEESIYIVIVLATFATIGIILLIAKIAKKVKEKKDPRNTLFREKSSKKLNDLRKLYLDETKTAYETRESMRQDRTDNNS